MRLRVFWPSESMNSGTASIFHIQPAAGEGHRPARGEELKELESAIPRISSIGDQIFGPDFISVIIDKRIGRLELAMSKGAINRGRKRDFDTFRGWIELCTME